MPGKILRIQEYREKNAQPGTAPPHYEKINDMREMMLLIHYRSLDEEMQGHVFGYVQGFSGTASSYALHESGREIRRERGFE